MQRHHNVIFICIPQACIVRDACGDTNSNSVLLSQKVTFKAGTGILDQASITVELMTFWPRSSFTAKGCLVAPRMFSSTSYRCDQSISRHCWMPVVVGEEAGGSLPWMKTIALDVFSTFLEMCRSLQGLRGHTMMGNVYNGTSTATKQGTAQQSRGQRRRVHQDLCVCPMIKGAKVHLQSFKNVWLPCHHYSNWKISEILLRAMRPHWMETQSFWKLLASQDLQIS